MTTRAKPLPFQREGVLEMERLGGRVLLADEQGLGKTLECLWYYRRNRHTWPAVVVCPAPLKYMWERMASIHIGVRSYVCESRKPPARGFHPNANLYIINYEILKWWVAFFQNRVKPQLVVADECQRIQNPKTQHAKAVASLCVGVPHVVGSSGTPLSNRPIELWSICNIIWPEKFPSYVKYGYEFCKPTLDVRGQIVFRGAHNTKELNTRLRAAGMVRRLQVDVLDQLPPLTQTVIPIPLHDPRGEYAAAVADFTGWLKRNGHHRAARAGTAAGLVRVGYLLRLAARHKLRNALHWVDGVVEDPGQKIVLLGHHIKMMEALERRYAGRCVRVDGTVKGRVRDAAIHRFQHDKKVQVFIGNKAAIEGHTLTAANLVAFLELYWRPGDHNQGKKRIHRIGQDKPCFAYFLVARGTIEEYLCEVIQSKQSTITSIMDGEDADNDLDIYDMLVRYLMAPTPTVQNV